MRLVARAGSIAARVGGLAGWRRRLFALFLGVLAALALPPLHMIPFLVIGMTGLVWLLDGSTGWRRAGLDGWWFGFGYFAFGLYWISSALLVDAARHAWLIPFAVGGLAAGLALFTALATVCARLLWSSGTGRVLVLAATWTGAEWLRGTILTGFPWNLTGTVWAFSPAMIQTTALTGVLGLGLATILAAAAPATLADRRDGAAVFLPAAAALALVAIMHAGGSLRLAGAAVPGTADVPGLVLRIVQPNIPQAIKWDPGLRERHFTGLMALSTGPGFDGVSQVIWPETAIPWAVNGNPERRAAVARAAPPGGHLIAGGVRVEGGGDTPLRVWNSLFVIAADGEIAAVYDKHHLVPFGEYMPFRDLLGPLGLDKFTEGGVDFSPGPGPELLSAAGLPAFSPLVCYEAIFSGFVRPATAGGGETGWLLNVTNDAWFGESAGPWQHFASARLRAVEEGLPLVRAANTGISAIIDPWGRIVARLPLGEAGVIDAPLPAPLEGGTPFSRYGNRIPLVLCVIFLVAGVIVGRRRIFAGAARRGDK